MTLRYCYYIIENDPKQKCYSAEGKTCAVQRTKMKKLTKILTVAMACAITFGAAGCAKDVTYADYINPTDTTETPAGDKYVVNVRSAGGLSLNDVKVSLKRADGSTYKTGISKDGKIEFSAALGEYTLEVDESSLPEGYYLDGTVYKTDPDERKEVTIKIPSKVIDQTASSSTSYAVGDIIRDFVFTDCTGYAYRLSDTLKTKKAVVLNFWYTGCSPCKAEFPYIQQAYTANPDVEFFGFCSTHQGDTNKTVSEYKTSNNLPTLPLGIDNIGLGNNFGVTAYPTTVVIDRYGLIAYRSTGSEPSLSFWNSLFGEFTSDNYTQNPEIDDEPSDGIEQIKPDVSMPASSEIENALNSDGVTATYRADTDEYSWPWLVGADEDGQYVYSSNKGVGNSYAILIATVKMKQRQLLSFDYNVSTEVGNDCLYVIIDNENIIPDGLSGDSGWKTYDLYVADRDKEIQLVFTYIKDAADPDDDSIGEDVVKIRNLRLSDASETDTALDVMRPAASGLEDGAVKYSNYITPVLGSDGYYHKDSANGPLIYMTIDQLTPWSDLHMNGNTSENDTAVYYNTLYSITYNEYSNQAYGDEFAINIGGEDITNDVLAFVSVSHYVGTDYNLMPVNEELKHWADLFCSEKAREQNRPTYSEEWLEFCYYYDHYGPDHADTDHCYVNYDPTEGLSVFNSFTAGVKGIDKESNKTYDASTGRNYVDIDYLASEATRGDYYKLVAPETGVYSIRSFYVAESPETTPYLFIYDTNNRLLNDPQAFVRDFNQVQDETYEGFNEYIYLEKGQTMFLRLAVYFNETGAFEFEVTYHGESYSTLFDAITDGGRGIYDETTNKFYLSAVDVVYDSATDCYYTKDKNGEPDYDEPIYINMIYKSTFMSEFNDTLSNGDSLENIMDVEGSFIGTQRGKMLTYLQAATDKPADDPYYGMVRANAEVVSLIQDFISTYDGFENGWLVFGLYLEHFGADI